MRNRPHTAAAALMLIFTVHSAASALPKEDEQFRAMERHFNSGRVEDLQSAAKQFFKTYPKSGHIPDIRLMLADTEEKPDEALRLYRILAENYRYYVKRDLVYYKICETLYLLARWDDLITTSRKALELCGKSGYAIQYRFFLAHAYLYRERYDDARVVCNDIIDSHHGYEDLAAALLMLADIDKKTTGYSRSYLSRLREIITGFGNSKSAPAALYLLGRFYESQNDANRAYSAYTDVKTRYPQSPESLFAENRLNNLKAPNPVRTEYLPNDAMITSRHTIELNPEMDAPDSAASDAPTAYAIALGPFDSITSAAEIRTLIQKEFSPVELIRIGRRYMLYVGRHTTSESALPMKIRLAEEYGINGTVAVIKKDEHRHYIYGE